MESDESLLLAALRHDSSEHVFKYLAAPDAGRLECAFTSELVFVPAGGGEALLRLVAGRWYADALKKGATHLVPLGEQREGRTTWAKELLWIYLALLRIGGANKMISAGRQHSLMTSSKVGGGGRFGGVRSGIRWVKGRTRKVEKESRRQRFIHAGMKAVEEGELEDHKTMGCGHSSATRLCDAN